MKIFYIPGLGEGLVLGFQKAYISLLNVFRSEDRKIIVFTSRWASKESYKNKYQRLEELYNQEDKPRIVVAPSAGGSLASTLLENNESIDVAHVVCAKMKGPEKIGKLYQKRAPALVAAVEASQKSLQNIREDVMICYAPKSKYDGIVERVDMVDDRQKVVSLPRLFHTYAIVYWLFRYLPRL